MADKPQSNEVKPGMTEASTPAPQPRASGPISSQRPADARDAMAEMAERAQLISQEAGNKVASAMKDVIGAAAGIAGFAVESARDLLQYMVRRGQMSQDEADRLIRDAEDAQGKRPSADRGRPSSAKGVADRGPAREVGAREPVSRADHPSAATPAASKSAPPAKSIAAKKHPPAAASAKPAKKSAAKVSSGEKKTTPKKPGPSKKRR